MQFEHKCDEILVDILEEAGMRTLEEMSRKQFKFETAQSKELPNSKNIPRRGTLVKGDASFENYVRLIHKPRDRSGTFKTHLRRVVFEDSIFKDFKFDSDKTRNHLQWYYQRKYGFKQNIQSKMKDVKDLSSERLKTLVSLAGFFTEICSSRYASKHTWKDMLEPNTSSIFGIGEFEVLDVEGYDSDKFIFHGWKMNVKKLEKLCKIAKERVMERTSFSPKDTMLDHGFEQLNNSLRAMNDLTSQMVAINKEGDKILDDLVTVANSIDPQNFNSEED